MERRRKKGEEQKKRERETEQDVDRKREIAKSGRERKCEKHGEIENRRGRERDRNKLREG